MGMTVFVAFAAAAAADNILVYWRMNFFSFKIIMMMVIADCGGGSKHCQMPNVAACPTGGPLTSCQEITPPAEAMGVNETTCLQTR